MAKEPVINKCNEDMLLVMALKSISLKFWKKLRSWDVITDITGKLEFYGYAVDGSWIDTGILNAETLGKVKMFVRADASVFSSQERSKMVIENPFFGVKSLEELSICLDLLGCKKDVMLQIK